MKIGTFQVLSAIWDITGGRSHILLILRCQLFVPLWKYKENREELLIKNKMEICKIKENELNPLIDLYSHYIDKKEVPPLSDQAVQEIWENIKGNPCINHFVGKLNNALVASCILKITPSFIRGGKAFGMLLPYSVIRKLERLELSQ